MESPDDIFRNVYNERRSEKGVAEGRLTSPASGAGMWLARITGVKRRWPKPISNSRSIAKIAATYMCKFRMEYDYYRVIKMHIKRVAVRSSTKLMEEVLKVERVS
jgi:hypothetical protein